MIPRSSACEMYCTHAGRPSRSPSPLPSQTVRRAAVCLCVCMCALTRGCVIYCLWVQASSGVSLCIGQRTDARAAVPARRVACVCSPAACMQASCAIIRFLFAGENVLELAKRLGLLLFSRPPLPQFSLPLHTHTHTFPSKS